MYSIGEHKYDHMLGPAADLIGMVLGVWRFLRSMVSQLPWMAPAVLRIDDLLDDAGGAKWSYANCGKA